MNIIRRENEFAPIEIAPPSFLEFPRFRELWEYKGLLFFLIRRDIKLRFQQTVIGFLWIILQPLIQMSIFYVFLGVLVKVPTGNVPYHIFFLSAFIVWQLFSQIINLSALSLVGNIGIIIKCYFPRMVLPLSTVVSALIDFGISFLLLLLFLLIDNIYSLSFRYLLIPVLLVITTVFASGVGLLFGAMMVLFRDMKNLLGFILQIWMYLTPIMYPISIVPEKYQIIFYLNPLTALVDAYRWVFLRQGNLPRFDHLLISLVVATVLWFSGAIVFRSMENKIADVM
ncbi:MAG TPA: ABC transporter permease [Anaerolineae bacterium]|nr:ABC transporter permease [Anaerolineae bacterium]